MAARFRVRKSAAWHDITKWRVYWLGAWREVVRARRWTKLPTNPPSFGWKDVYIKAGTTPTPSPSPTPTPTPTAVTLSVTTNVTSVSGSRVGTGIATTNAVTATARRGTPPYTFRWTRGNYSGSIAPTVNSPNSATTTFSRDMQGIVPETQTSRPKITVTDSKGNKGSAFVDASFNTVAQAGTGGTGGGLDLDPSDRWRY